MKSKSINSNVDNKKISEKKLKEAKTNLDEILKRIEPFVSKKKIAIHSTDCEWIPTSFLQT